MGRTDATLQLECMSLVATKFLDNGVMDLEVLGIYRCFQCS